jgi:hypothetical protein
MKMAEKKPLYKRTWFIVVAVFVLLGAVGNMVGGSEPEPTESAQISSAPGETADSAPDDESPIPSPSQSDSPLSNPDSEESIEYFSYSARGQFIDLNKDLDDADRRANADQKIRLLGNILELSFNLGQLEALDPPTKIAEAWKAGLSKLENEIDSASDVAADFTAGDASTSQVIGALEKVRTQVASLSKLVSKVK